mgnify:CR=1 FL=1
MSFVLSWKFLVMVKLEIRIGLEVPDTPRVLAKKLRTLSLVRISTSNVQIVAPKNDTVLRVELQVEGEIGIDRLKKAFCRSRIYSY